MHSSPAHIIVIGGGFAGLTAAVALTEQGNRVTLLERRPTLGGRARSFQFSSNEEIVDNGQHVLLGCYRNTLHFLKTIGSENSIFFQKRLTLKFRQKGGIVSLLSCPPLPAPWHLLLGLGRFRPLRFRDKWNTWKIARAIQKGSATESLTVTEWLIQLDQSPSARESLWNPLVIAALNESPDRASARLFLKVLQETFRYRAEDSRIGLASSGLSKTYAEPAYRWLKEQGADIRLQTNIESIRAETGRTLKVILSNGESLSGDGYICAIPPRDLLAILPQSIITADPAFSNLHQLKASPIISINLWFNRPLFEELFIGLLRTKIQWVFNRSYPCRDSKLETRNFFYSCVISAAYPFLNQENESLIQLALQEIQSCFPEVKGVSLIKSQVIREPNATLSSAPEVEKYRPLAKTSLDNFVLAGDWVRTGLPATIESAVLSGYQAARRIQEYLVSEKPSTSPSLKMTTVSSIPSFR